MRKKNVTKERNGKTLIYTNFQWYEIIHNGFEVSMIDEAKHLSFCNIVLVFNPQICLSDTLIYSSKTYVKYAYDDIL